MKFHVLQHVPFEDLADIGTYLEEKGHTYEYCKLYLDEPLPRAVDVQGLFIMGGPMNIYEDDKYPWLKLERDFIRRVIERGTPAVGICLGAQLLSDALGGIVQPNKDKEIGWFPVDLTQDGLESPLMEEIPEHFTAFHWHGDTFQLAPGADLLIYNKTTLHQAFSFTQNDMKVLGLQFHLEYTTQSIEKMLNYCSDELVDGEFIMTADQIRDEMQNVENTHKLLFKLLDNASKMWFNS